MLRKLIMTALLGWLTGCAAPMPAVLQESLPEFPTVDRVREEPNAHLGQRVRWGGTIAAIANRRSDARIEIVARALDSRARPVGGDSSSGRFVAIIEGFVEPTIAAPGREITVVGTVTGIETGNVGEFAYQFPVVGAARYHLWEPRPAYRPEDDPFWYDPWRLWYPYPWWHPRYD